MSSFYRRTNYISRPIPKLEKRGAEPFLKLQHIQYDTPEIKDIAVLIVFFNPAHSIRIIHNLLYVKSLLEAANIPSFYGELAFGDDPFVLPAAANVFQWRSDSYMFYKENLLALLTNHIPATYTKLCLLDADIVFGIKDWYKQLSNLLDTHTIVQPYSDVYLLDISFKKESMKPSCLKTPNGHCGFAWAFQRAWFQRNAIYEYALIGGGDSVFGERLGVLEKWSSAYIDDVATLPALETHTKTFMNTVVYHLPHGNRSKRQYMTRHEILKKQIGVLGAPNLKALVFRESNGLLSWKPEYKKSMNELMLTYFLDRDDDGI
jgi:hypothetical protein